LFLGETAFRECVFEEMWPELSVVIAVAVSFSGYKDWSKKAVKKANERCLNTCILVLYKVVQSTNNDLFYSKKRHIFAKRFR
jgi:hypothetical protein